MKIPGGGGMQRQLMKQMEQLQRDMEEAQRQLGEMRLVAAAGGGVVVATANGSGEIVDLRIAPEAVDPSDVEMLQDLVLAAVREALEKSRKAQEEKMGGLTGGLGIPGF
jgi:DNA-binding YbaB/EbfC family protein